MKKLDMNYFRYGCNSVKEYNLIRNEKTKVNYKVWKITSALSAVYFFIMFLTTFSIDVVQPNCIVDFVLMMISFCVFVLLCTIVKPGSKALMPVIYFMNFSLLMFGIIIGCVLSPEYLAVTYHVLMLGLPLIVVDKPYRMGILEFATTILFVIITFVKKSGETQSLDIYNAVMFMFLSQFVNYYMVYTKMQHLLSNKRNELSSITDEMTRLYNRKAYEYDIAQQSERSVSKDFVYVAMDVNGLKKANDDLGHDAGDELLKGAAQCISRCFGSYGKTYRIGGDEFAAIIYADEKQLSRIAEDFEHTLLHWRGTILQELTISTGYVSSREFPQRSVYELAKIADQRMYQKKSEFYQKAGVDRRGEHAAHVALCAVYTKILKINLTYDTFRIIKMDMEEQSIRKGYSTKISEWLSNFAMSGQVHPDDQEKYLKYTDLTYLRDYFHGKKASISISYRRKIEEEYKLATMEMIPSDDYRDTDQNLFLYVKYVDK